VGEAIQRSTDQLTELAQSAWPKWFGGVDLAWYRDDALGNAQLREITRLLAEQDARISQQWVMQAVQLAADKRVPNPPPSEYLLQVMQVCLAISPAGVSIVVPFQSAYERQKAVIWIAIVEWLSHHAPAAVVPLIPMHWPDEAPVDRLLFNAWQLSEDESDKQVVVLSNETTRIPSRIAGPTISGIRGYPHPLSDVEKRIWASLAADEEMGALFSCNQTVETVRGQRPRVDLLWSEGKLIVEFDGYADHGTPFAFERDRHRDYELMMTGYRVLRIANDEVHRDLEAAVSKIRDVVRYQRISMRMEKPR
jgi:very-short-patch-repair endonuclease